MIPITFSIVTPSYNQGRFLEEAIRSVLGQKGDFHIDYIITDGGSTDDSVEIIKKYERLLADGKLQIGCRGIRYRWVSEKDKGQADAIEKGFALTSGDIGAWLNSDDVYFNDEVFAAVARYFNSEDIDLLIGNGILIDRGGNFIGNYQTEKIDIKELIFLDYHILQPSAFLRLEYFKKNNFDKNKKNKK
jgi:glycosyltransferase involved in cell wall biosynthesis